MKISKLFRDTNFNNSMLLGFYGGGNFGDELLLEVLLNKLYLENCKNVKVFNLNYIDFHKYHTSFKNTEIINLKSSKWKFLWASLLSRNIVVGGGGLWGLDFNFNVLVFSLYLFVMRFLFFKKVFLIGVGFYNSTTRMGRVMGWFSAKAANIIIARDAETFTNFSRISKNKVFLDRDIVFYLNEFVGENIGMEREVEEIRENFLENDDSMLNVLMVSRRFKKGKGDGYGDVIRSYVKNNRNVKITLAIMEPRQIDAHGYEGMKEIGDKFNARYFDFDFNPLAFYFFLKKYGNNLIIIAPQYHVQLVAYLAGVAFMPISYDNKCDELFKMLKIEKFYNVNKLKVGDIVDFVNSKKM
jgi:polysaccharide pyruvyl transferase WcaK-like protein